LYIVRKFYYEINNVRLQLALALGGGGLPKRLAFSLPRIFIETFGAWARDERARRVAINLADSTDVP
jgi:hypothetical protein